MMAPNCEHPTRPSTQKMSEQKFCVSHMSVQAEARFTLVIFFSQFSFCFMLHWYEQANISKYVVVMTLILWQVFFCSLISSSWITVQRFSSNHGTGTVSHLPIKLESHVCTCVCKITSASCASSSSSEKTNVRLVGKQSSIYLFRQSLAMLTCSCKNIAKHVLSRQYKNVFREHMEETTGGLLLMTSSIFIPEATRSQLNPVTPPQAQSKAWDSFVFFPLFSCSERNSYSDPHHENKRCKMP